jgi:hypothetical protein
MVASAAGNEEIVQFLLTNGASVNDIDRWGSTALWDAIISDQMSENVAKMLISYGAKVLLPTYRLVGYLNRLVSDCHVHQVRNIFTRPTALLH